MENNPSKFALNYKGLGSDKLIDLSRSGGKLGHVDGDLIEGLTEKRAHDLRDHGALIIVVRYVRQ